MRSGRGSGSSDGSAAISDTWLARAVVGGDAEPSELPSAPVASKSPVTRITRYPIAGQADYRIGRRKTRAIALQCGSRRDDEIGRRLRLKNHFPEGRQGSRPGPGTTTFS